MSADTPIPVKDEAPKIPRTGHRTTRMPVADHREIVQPAHPNPNHLAIVITAVACMLAAAIVAGVLITFGEVTPLWARSLGSVIGMGVLILGACDVWFRRTR